MLPGLGYGVENSLIRWSIWSANHIEVSKLGPKYRWPALRRLGSVECGKNR